MRPLVAGSIAFAVAIAVACSDFETTPSSDAPDATDDAAEDSGGGDAPITSDGGSTTIVDVAAGETFACALRENGRVLCWGSNLDGAIGELGGTTDDTCDDNLPCRFTPREVPGIEGVVQIAASPKTVFARKHDGTVWAWGSNEHGLLGLGSTVVGSRAAPKAIDGIVNAVDIVGGFAIACARLSDKEVKCWGANDRMILQDTTSGVRGPSLLPNLKTSKQIRLSLTSSYGCAVGDDDRVRCWGRSYSGNLGYDLSDGGDASATELDCGAFGDKCQPTPLAIGDLTASSITTGHFTSCAQRLSGGVVCWGYNEVGALGNDTSDYGTHAIPELAAPIPEPVQLAGGGRHFCSLHEGKVHCWGRNEEGELGNAFAGGETCITFEACSKKPVLPSLPGPAKRIAAGKALTVALLEDGRLFAWGANMDARLGHKPGDMGDLQNCDFDNKKRCNPNPQLVAVP